MKPKFVILFFLFFSPLLRRGAGGEVLSQNFSIQDSVYNLYIDFFRSQTAAGKYENSKKFSEGLNTALALDPKGQFPFDSLKKYKVMIESSDKLVRIFTWEVEAEDGTHTYF